MSLQPVSSAWAALRWAQCSSANQLVAYLTSHVPLVVKDLTWFTLEACVAHLNSHFPLVARDLTQPVWLLSTTLEIISLSGGSQESTDFPWLPQNTCSR